MTITRRPYLGELDQPRMAELAGLAPAHNLHVVDLPYRFCSWALDDQRNCALWEDERGDLLAWVALQSPFWAIDYALHPSAPTSLHEDVLLWADGRASAVRDTPFGRPMWFVNVFEEQHERRRQLEARGFASQADVGENSWTKVLLQQPAAALPQRTAPPDGFTIRPLRGEAEVDAYVALHRAVFQSESMTAAWRWRTLRHPGYRAELDLVAVDAEERLAGFCVGWLADGGDGRLAGQVEPMGVRGDVRRAGLGRALLGECLWRLARAGAQQLIVETDDYRGAAFDLYQSLGFSVARRVLVYRKDYREETP